MSDDKEGKFIIEKIRLAGQKVNEPILEKSIKEISSENKYTKLIIGPYFCECGRRIGKENVNRCSHCGKLLCDECASKWEYLGKVHCKQCLSNYHDISLTRQEYLILLCISNGIRSSNKIFKLTGVKPSSVRKIIHSLIGKYLTKTRASFRENFFPKLRLTDLGNDALQIFERVYGRDEGSSKVKQRIAEFKAKLKEF